MDILKTATDWAKAEMFSSGFFVIFGIVFLLTSLGFWQLGKTELAKSYAIPTLVAGILLVILGGGLIFSNQMRFNNFPAAFEADASAFIATEIARVEDTIRGYTSTVLTVIPVIIIICALLFIFMTGPLWRASLVTIMAMLSVVLFVDTNAVGRLEVYKEKLQQADQ